MEADKHIGLVDKKSTKLMEYSVKSNDTLASIALKFNTTRSELTRMNRLSSRLLFPGQTLFVPVKIDLLEKEAQRKKNENHIELVTNAPQPRGYPERQMSQSPDYQMEELLRRDETHKDEVSEKYLSITGRYITDGQGVVPGILLITPQTVMFNPSVSDHLVIDRGREAYVVRAPLKAIKEISYYKDVAAMVLGDTSMEFFPDTSFANETKQSKTNCDSMDTSNYVTQNTVEMLSDTNTSMQLDKTEYSLKGEDTTEKICDDISVDRRDATFDQTMSQDEKFTTCCSSQMSLNEMKSQESNVETSLDSQMSISEAKLQESSTEMSLDQANSQAVKDLTSKTVESENSLAKCNTSANTRTELTNNDRKNMSAEITRDAIDIMDTECTSTPRKIADSKTVELTDMRKSKYNEDHDSGFIYTTVKSKDTVKMLTGNSVKLEQNSSDETKRRSRFFRSMNSRKDPESFYEDESSTWINASRDSGISEGLSLLTNSSSGTNRERSRQHKTLSPRSSLSTEARLWLGRRGIHVNSESDDSEGSCIETFNVSQEDLVTPRPAAPSADELTYLCLKIRRSYWYRPSARSSHIMGVPPNRDQQRMEHWFAVPTTRVNQIHSFLKCHCPEPNRGIDGKDAAYENEENTNKVVDEISIVDDTFPRPIVKENLGSPIIDHAFLDTDTYKNLHNLGQVSRKSAASSLNEDDQPELTEDSNILDSSQIATISRELPSRTVGHRWDLVYSTAVHGISLKTLYRNTLNLETPILLVVLDQEGKTFGAFMSEAPRISEGFYGTGESLLFSFEDSKRVKVHRWTGMNTFFIKGDSKCLAIGGGDGLFGLWLDEDLYHGRSHSCKTFDNDTLSTNEDFICRGLEAWTFG